MSVTTVKTEDCKLPEDYSASERNIRKCMQTLETQGLIEPLVVQQTDTAPYIITTFNWYDGTYLLAAQRLNWPTVIVVAEKECDQ